MFTIKFIYPDGTEMITTDWDMVSAEYQDINGTVIDLATPVHNGNHPDRPAYRVVHAHNENQDRRMTFGPILPGPGDGPAMSLPPARVYVMNETGATVASYSL